ncbi:ParB/RepB/Spo0J family partition protein [Candidatus Nanosynsacchari sp. TM7_ANC_38.39_G1_1]|uniref:ParB/RepB/Spo0J family partition protein n=1 Tax=Candidatus Nanosynsacchari sp. TM7_ANC_38.39_G1_1 TaxID=1986206 RepID=UPI00101DBE8C|nr:ParB/RepB/Spo0J family partition protein [Candidatus Nanosynsacchari sp. TM7_ANC_38.39_G1_1]RYC73867.1 putative chromosome-partitioning protein ParB [Candidatus Nanosynsacchari sp. TM7_ANC_38.39_G1_1]
MPAKKGLGRGFDSLIPTELLDESFDPTAEQDERVSDLRYIKLASIMPDPDQPRREFDDDALVELSKSIKEHGVLQPVVVRPHGDGYMIVAGERRFRASKLAKLDRIPALVRTLSGQHRLELSLIENIQRRDLNPLETATAYLKLRDQFNLTLDDIGKRVGKTSAAIANTMRLLRLPGAVRDIVARGELSEGQARSLTSLPEEEILRVVPIIIKEQWSARTIERYVSNYKKLHGAASTKGRKAVRSSRFIREEESFAKRFGTPVVVKETRKGAGRIIISFKDQADFERIAKLLGE